MDEIDVERSPEAGRYQCLEKIVRGFRVHATRQQSQTHQHAPTVTVDGENVPIERIQKDAAGDFRTDARELSKKVLGLPVTHGTQRRQCDASESLSDTL
jgi:hypothetical protein